MSNENHSPRFRFSRETLWLTLLLVALCAVIGGSIYFRARARHLETFVVVTSGDVDRLRELTKRGISVDHPEFLEQAVLDSNLEVVDFLLRHGADPDADSFAGATIVNLAGASASPDVFFRVVRDAQTFDPNETVWNDDSVFRWRLRYVWEDQPNVEVLQFFIDAGADVNGDSGDTAFPTPLFLATSSQGSAENVDLLCAYGADVNALNSHGYSPIFYAIPELEKVQILVENGADLTIVDDRGRTPLDLAREMYADTLDPKHQEVVDYLASHDPAES